MQNLACGSLLSPPCISWWQPVMETTAPVPLGCLYSFHCRMGSVESQNVFCMLPSQGCCGDCQCVLPWEDIVCNLCTIYKGNRARSSACFTAANFVHIPRLAPVLGLRKVVRSMPCILCIPLCCNCTASSPSMQADKLLSCIPFLISVHVLLFAPLRT